MASVRRGDTALGAAARPVPTVTRQAATSQVAQRFSGERHARLFKSMEPGAVMLATLPFATKFSRQTGPARSESPHGVHPGAAAGTPDSSGRPVSHTGAAG